MADYSLGVAELATKVNLSGIHEGMDKAKGVASAGGGGIGGAISTAFSFATGTLLAGGLTAIGGVVTNFFASAVGDARGAAVIMAQTEAVIRSTGGAAGKSAQEIADYAASLSAASGKSLFGDDQIQESANLLLTFTNIKGTVLDASTAISVDMAQALGGAPADAAIQLGKALNDPIAGISALSRVGVTFDDQQKATIKTMVEAGNVAGAQGIILAELNKEFGGSAQAAAEADGGYAQFQDRIGEVGESIGGALLPALTAALGLVNSPEVLGGIEALGTGLAVGLGGAVAWLASDGLPALMAGWQALSPVMDVARSLFDAFAVGLGDGGGLTGGLSNLLYALDPISPIFDTIGDAVVTLGDLLPTIFATISASLGAAVPSVDGLATTWGGASALITGLITGLSSITLAVFGAIGTFLAAHGGEIQTTLSLAWQQIGTIVQTTIALLSATVVPAFAAIGAFITAHGSEIQLILTAAWQIISNVIGGALTIIQGLVTAALQLVQGNWSGAWTTIQTMSASVLGSIGNIIKGALDLIAGFFNTTTDGILTTWSSNLEKLTAVASGVAANVMTALRGGLATAASIGADLVAGIRRGITGAWDGFMSWMRGKIMELPQAVRTALGIHSPSQVFADLVGMPIVAGIAAGIQNGAPLATSALSGVASGLATQLGAMASTSSQALSSALQSALHGAADVSRTHGEIASNTLDQLGRSLSRAGGIGSDLVAGIRSGFDGAWRGLVSTMGAKMMELPQAVRTALKIHSPSEVFADMVGMPIVAGIAMGIANNAHLAKNALADLADTLAKQLDDLAERAERAMGDALMSAAGGSADIARTRARTVADIQKLNGAIAENARFALKSADDEATALAVRDPALATKYYQLRTRQIMEIADLQGEMASATTDTERAQVSERLALALDAQDKERAALRTTVGVQGDALDQQRASLDATIATLTTAFNAATQNLEGAPSLDTLDSYIANKQAEINDTANGDDEDKGKRGRLERELADFQKQRGTLADQLATRDALGGMLPSLIGQRRALGGDTAGGLLGRIGPQGVDVGGITIYQQPGESAEALTDRIIRALNQRIATRG